MCHHVHNYMNSFELLSQLISLGLYIDLVVGLISDQVAKFYFQIITRFMLFRRRLQALKWYIKCLGCYPIGGPKPNISMRNPLFSIDFWNVQWANLLKFSGDFSLILWEQVSYGMQQMYASTRFKNGPKLKQTLVWGIYH